MEGERADDVTAAWSVFVRSWRRRRSWKALDTELPSTHQSEVFVLCCPSDGKCNLVSLLRRLNLKFKPRSWCRTPAGLCSLTDAPFSFRRPWAVPISWKVRGEQKEAISGRSTTNDRREIAAFRQVPVERDTKREREREQSD